MLTKSFKEVVDKYEVVFFDAFGVFKNYRGVIPGANDTFKYLEDAGKKYYILTNDASRSPQQLSDSYTSIGLKQLTPDKIISSGMLATDYLNHKVNKGTIAYLGTENCAHYLKSTGLKALSIADLDLERANEISALVFMDDEGFDWNVDINKAINLLRKRNIPVIVANTDVAYPVSYDEIALAIGGIADLIETVVDKHFIRFGKPDTQMFNFALNHISPGQQLDKDDILMVGDTLFTDIIGGNKFGLDTVLVLTGNTQRSQAENRIRATGIAPTYICPSIALD